MVRSSTSWVTAWSTVCNPGGVVGDCGAGARRPGCRTKGCLVNDGVVGGAGVASGFEEDVVQVRDSGHRVGKRAGGAAVVAEDLEVLHPGQDVFDAGPDLAVGGVEVFLPG